ncbi:DUF1961 family protein [Alteromonas gilva]|uniref:DUF1961 family protein n=1 Tax=Alteromonas gilva TaxID=2987522 RepID=A0ABT5KWW2_9ALTE|nr:DUF1961 family protein [Alteromonas gilva]MDC8829255.1 DUF1961 family protein [Alteromonas gilva]
MNKRCLHLLFCVLFLSVFSGCTERLASPNPPPDMTSSEPSPSAAVSKGMLLYSNAMASAEDVSDWVMEGPGILTFDDGWMQMSSPNETMHHVFWCPEEFPDNFIAEWQAQPLKTDAGLTIVFFAAKGANGESIFDPSLPARDGTFSQYTEGSINSYHISYYANAAHNPDRGHANLRKNNTFTLLQEGKVGIPTYSDQVHQIRLVKHHNHIQLFVDGDKVIDYTDDQPVINGVDTGAPYTSGRIGFRQMKWTHFQYRNFNVWAID